MAKSGPRKLKHKYMAIHNVLAAYQKQVVSIRRIMDMACYQLLCYVVLHPMFDCFVAATKTSKINR